MTYTFKILSGPLNGLDMTLECGIWHLYAYNQNSEAAMVEVNNHAVLASKWVIFIPLYTDVIQMQLHLDDDQARIGWLADENTDVSDLELIMLQRKMTCNSLCFALKRQDEEWALRSEIFNVSQPQVKAEETKAVFMDTRWYPWRIVSLLMLAVLIFLCLWRETAQPLPTARALPLQAIQQVLSAAGIIWLTVQQPAPQHLRLRLLASTQNDEQVKRAEQLVRQRFASVEQIDITLYSLKEIEQELRLLFEQAGVEYKFDVTPTGIYVAIRQELTPETLDYLGQRLQRFYQTWGTQCVNVSIQLPLFSGDSPGAVLHLGQSQFFWDKKNHLFIR